MSDSYVHPLPQHPDWDQQRRLAKELLHAVQAGEPEALARAEALHPSFDRDAFRLADAQLVLARGYGYASWARLKERIDALRRTPLDQFRHLIYTGDLEGLRRLFAEQPDIARHINDPLFSFGGRAAMQAKKNLPVLDFLLEHGADLNLRSDWWAGSFGILDHTTPEQAAPLIARGAEVDVWSASALGDLDRLREMLEADPSLLHARGGDGQTPLHFAANVEIASYLLGLGAAIDARCIDHESTPAQWAIGDRPEVARYLVEQGAWCDIFLATALGDLARVEQCVADDPGCLDYTVGEPPYSARHAAKGEVRPDHDGSGERGNIYTWTLPDWNVPGVAAKLGHHGVLAWILERATPAQRLVIACAEGDGETARRLMAEHPGLIARLGPGEQRRLADAVRDRNHAAVALMLELGFPVNVGGQHGATPLHWAAWRADLALVEALLAHDPPLEAQDPDHHSTPLGWAVYGSTNGWDPQRAEEFGPVVRRLLAAGCRADAAWLPCGNEAVDEALREVLAD